MISYKPLYKTLTEKGLTEKDLSDFTGINCAKLKYRLFHNHLISLETIEKFCLFLNVGLDKIIDWTPGNQDISFVRNIYRIDWTKYDKILKRDGHSYTSLSQMLGMGDNYIVNLKSSGRTVEKETMEKICKKMKCKIEDIAVLERTEVHGEV